MGEPEPDHLREAEACFVVNEIDTPDPQERYRARLYGAEHYGAGETVREAVKAAAIATLEEEFLVQLEQDPTWRDE